MKIIYHQRICMTEITKGSSSGWKEILSDGNLCFQEELKSTGNVKYLSKYKSLIFDLYF